MVNVDLVTIDLVGLGSFWRILILSWWSLWTELYTDCDLLLALWLLILIGWWSWADRGEATISNKLLIGLALLAKAK